ncbi:GNAT family N-acetyltransferase [Paenibacillus sp. FA6]|uniref:GNAT family N-acetyltransferase n=1 Tax=Paenibacillus sp. FA6 TaxID=3413029 RepID=UPI003F65A6AE
MMFKRVENELELARYHSIWTTVWLEKGFELEFSEEVLERFVIVTSDGDYVGTSEIKPYSIHESMINEAAPFATHPKLIQAEGAVAEIDKMAVLKSYRGNFIADLLSAAVHYGEKNRLRYYVALLEPVFLRALRITFQVPFEKIGGKVFYKGDHVVPVIIDLEEVCNNKEQYSWLTNSQEMSRMRQTT